MVNDTAPMGSSADEATLRGSAYASFLQRAGLADLSDIEAMQLFYRAGVDGRGRPVFLFWAGHLPSRPIDLDRVLMHLLRTLDAHAVAAFSIVYVHTTLGPESEPPIGWLRKVHDLFDQRLKDNLHLMYVIHAPWWLKTAMNFMRTFAASGRWWDSKIIQLSHLVSLPSAHVTARQALTCTSHGLHLHLLGTGGFVQAGLLSAGITENARLADRAQVSGDVR